MRFGIQLPVQAQSRIFVESWERDAGPDELVAVARAAENAGFDYIAVCDHTVIPRELVDRMGAVWYDQFTTLGFLAAATTRVRLLTHVCTLPTRHPLAVAKAIATLDVLSKGRAILGVGAGHVEAEFAALGAAFEQRGRVLDEAIDTIRAALRDELPHVTLAPPAVQHPLPIWVGGSSKAALRRAATKGNGWLPQTPDPRELASQIGYLRAHAARPLDIGALTMPMCVGEPSWDLGRWTRTGSPEQLAAGIRPLRDLGATHVQIRLRSRSVDELCDQLAVFGSTVAPLVDP